MRSATVSSPVAGSAPRLRGIGIETDLASDGYRFSPARAGNRATAATRRHPAPVQPRACGEQGLVEWPCPVWSGSAPRVRGTGQDHPRRHARHRFSPARAGNRWNRRGLWRCRSVQPRACGEQGGHRVALCVKVGSAPRVRGTELGRREGRGRGRFSPARAGNSEARRVAASASAVQPRACGEQVLSRASTDVRSGSAPRVRGTVTQPHLKSCRRRFSPARAGNRLLSRQWQRPLPVQPRACGEQWIYSAASEG